MKFIYILLFTTISIVQNHTISGVVFDNLEKPLESANIIAKPLQENATLKFAIADNKGRYRLELESNVKYEITATYIGFKEQVIIIEPNSNIKTHDFILESTGKEIKEIIIKYETNPLK